ncbi:MAG TPA: hypothetical protein VHF45_06235 [Thermoleophilaceae bacterium]|nr:hypothetical protein [Thermoleophilaceae bacterium]
MYVHLRSSGGVRHDRPLDGITRIEAMDWAERVPPSRVPAVVTLFNAAIDAELVDRNPFRGLSHRGRSRGRSDEHPPPRRSSPACSTPARSTAGTRRGCGR